jgi:adenylate cyclase
MQTKKEVRVTSGEQSVADMPVNEPSRGEPDVGGSAGRRSGNPSRGSERTAPVPGVVPGADILDVLNVGVALADPATLSILHENPRFRQWLPAQEGGADLLSRFPEAIRPRVRERLERRRPQRFDVETRSGARTINLRVDLHEKALPGGPVIVAEAISIAKEKEAEYMLDSYAKLSERQARALEQEKERAERLLLNIMPRRVFEELKDFGTTTPQSFGSASVLMLDFVGFTEMAISREPGPLIAELNDVFTSFDRIVEHSGCERIKTVGDAYMAVAGLPESDPDHEIHIARAALRMRRFLERRNATAVNRWRCRIGIGTGPAIGSIVGIQKYVYDIFGPAVNMAARLEQRADPMQILISSSTHERIRDEFVLQSVGAVEVKGFGIQELYSLEDEARSGR